MNGGGTKADASGLRPDQRVGAILEQTRQALGQSLAEVARDLRIRKAFLEAIEAGRYEGLPGPAYTLGFIRTYAEHLGLEGDEIVRRFKAESGQAAPKSKLNFPSPMSESTAPKAAVLLIGSVVALLAYGIWYLAANRYLDVAELVVPLPEHLRQMLPGEERGVVAPVPPPGTSAPAKPEPTTAKAVPAAPASTAIAPPPSPAAAPSPPPAPPVPAEVNTAAAPPAAAPAPEVPGRIVVKATADSWVGVRDPARRTPLLSRLMRAGETFAVPDRPGLTLMTGNAGGLELTVDGQVLPPLGKSGTVRRAVPLNADQLKAAATTPAN